MSALTREEIGMVAAKRAGAPVSERSRFETMVDEALKSLARKVARRDDFEEMRKEIAVTAVAGVVTISDATLLLDTLQLTGVLILNGGRARWCEYRDIELTLPKDSHYFAVRNRKLYVKEVTTGANGTCVHTGTLEANYTPTLSELPASYDNELIGEVVVLAGGRAEGSPAPGMHGGEGESLNVSIGDNK